MIVSNSKTNLLILDDWGLEELSREHSLDMLEVLEDRLQLRIYHRHRPSARGPVARNHQQFHPDRCHPRSLNS
ncbi:hypothetical protein DFAR_1310008 [Desulfarculales bacterium]